MTGEVEVDQMEVVRSALGRVAKMARSNNQLSYQDVINTVISDLENERDAVGRNRIDSDVTYERSYINGMLVIVEYLRP